PELIGGRRPELHQRARERFGVDARPVTEVMIDLPRRVEPQDQEAAARWIVERGLVDVVEWILDALDDAVEFRERLEPVTVRTLVAYLDNVRAVLDEGPWGERASVIRASDERVRRLREGPAHVVVAGHQCDLTRRQPEP